MATSGQTGASTDGATSPGRLIGPDRQVRLRPVAWADYDAVQAVGRRNGLRHFSRDRWEQLWRINPFLVDGPAAPQGWVMETEADGIIGSAGNVVLGCEWRRRRLRVAVGIAWAVDARWRSLALAINFEYFAQPGLDLFMNTSAVRAAAAAWKAGGAREMPHAQSGRILYWITHPAGFAGSVLRRKKIPGAALLKFPAGAGLWALEQWRGRRPAARLRERVTAHTGFDERFDEFWLEQRRRRPDRLMVVRNRAALAWHFEFGFRSQNTFVLTLELEGRLTGYLVLRRKDAPESGLLRHIVVDLQVLEDNAEHVAALLAAALDLARAQGVHVVEVTGQEPFKRGVLESFAPRVRTGPSSAYWYKVGNRELEPAIHDPAVWDPSPYDGDASLCL